MNALLAGGFLESEINIACGQAKAAALDATTGRSGLAHVALRVAEKFDLSTDERDTKERYEQALRDGQCVIAIFAPSEERKRRSAQILEEHRGHFINYLRRFTIESIRR